MRKKKLDKTRREYASEWLGMTPREHLNQAAAVVGAVLADVADAGIGPEQLSHAQTHLLAGLLKTQLSGGDVGIPTD